MQLLQLLQALKLHPSPLMRSLSKAAESEERLVRDLLSSLPHAHLPREVSTHLRRLGCMGPEGNDAKSAASAHVADTQRQVLGDVGSSYFAPRRAGGALRAAHLPDLDESRKRDAEEAELAVADLRKGSDIGLPSSFDSPLLAALNQELELTLPAQIQLPESTMSSSGPWLGAELPGVGVENSSWVTRMLQGLTSDKSTGAAAGSRRAKRRPAGKSSLGVAAKDMQPTFGISPEEQQLWKMEAKITLDVRLKEEQLQAANFKVRRVTDISLYDALMLAACLTPTRALHAGPVPARSHPKG
jgi:hypothetical protein